ncbi:MAG TPA: RDD family protein [Ectothiorhodospiraceae bacterium]|nr:RDD family protein [Ectothiorhodospiraceae bacterium]
MPQNMNQSPPCSLGRRFAAIFYDAILLISLLAIANFLLIILLGTELAGTISGNPLIYIYYIGVSLLFFGWFWTHGGQTLGMRVWRVRLITELGEPINWPQATIRFGAAFLSWICAGAGFIWALFDRENRGWHDRASKSRLIVIPKK